jgi:hypothetical protein
MSELRETQDDQYVYDEIPIRDVSLEFMKKLCMRINRMPLIESIQSLDAKVESKVEDSKIVKQISAIQIVDDLEAVSPLPPLIPNVEKVNTIDKDLLPSDNKPEMSGPVEVKMEKIRAVQAFGKTDGKREDFARSQVEHSYNHDYVVKSKADGHQMNDVKRKDMKPKKILNLIRAGPEECNAVSHDPRNNLPNDTPVVRKVLTVELNDEATKVKRKGKSVSMHLRHSRSMRSNTSSEHLGYFRPDESIKSKMKMIDEVLLTIRCGMGPRIKQV